MSGGSSLPSTYASSIKVINAGVSSAEAYERITSLMEAGSFTGNTSILQAEGLTIRFREDSSGLADLYLIGSNAELSEAIVAEFD
jgi:hypothetical protein